MNVFGGQMASWRLSAQEIAASMWPLTAEFNSHEPRQINCCLDRQNRVMMYTIGAYLVPHRLASQPD